MSLLYVFDIDGTLLRADGAGGRAFERALVAQFGVEDSGKNVRFGGKTDPQILDEILMLSRGQPASLAERTNFLATYLGWLDEELASSVGFRVLPGVVEALDFLDGDSRALLGIGTGNVEAGAASKLRRAGLQTRFSFGGYGCDSAVRAELIACGIERGRTLRPDATEVIVVGDTIHDIAAARATGAIAVAVTTGADTREALLGADVIFDSLAELPAWHAANFAT